MLGPTACLAEFRWYVSATERIRDRCKDWDENRSREPATQRHRPVVQDSLVSPDQIRAGGYGSDQQSNDYDGEQDCFDASARVVIGLNGLYARNRNRHASKASRALRNANDAVANQPRRLNA